MKNNGGKALRVLIVEDSENDAVLLINQLKRDGYDPVYEIVDTADKFGAVLDKSNWDIIISDYVLPGFSGLEVLKILQDRGLDIPCIIVSGQITDEIAVSAMRSGARDYVMKNNLKRISPAIERELIEANTRCESQKFEVELRVRAAILDKSLDAILLRDMNNLIVYANEAALKAFGYQKEDLIGRNMLILIPPEAVPEYEERLKSIMGNEELIIEGSYVKKDKSLIPVEVHTHRIQIGYREYILSVARDITRRRLTQEIIRESEEKYRRIVDTANEGVAVINSKGTIEFVNAKFAQMHGETETELIGRHLFDLVDKEYVKEVSERIRNRKPGVSDNYEVKSHRKDGSIIWLSINATPFYDAHGQQIGNIGLCTDITEQKQLRDEKERFTRKLIEVQEEERNRISRELHDDTAQWLALVTLEMDSIIVKGQQLPPDIQARLQRLRETTEKALQEVRRFSHELRPSVLEHFGLTASVELIVGEFNKSYSNTGTEVKLSISGNERRLSEEIELVLFRIAQESLSNIRKHARATDVRVEIIYADHLVTLTVTDNGQGFETNRKMVDSIGRGLGLVGMRERAQLIGGSLSVKSAPGQGTTVEVKIPVKDGG